MLCMEGKIMAEKDFANSYCSNIGHHDTRTRGLDLRHRLVHSLSHGLGNGLTHKDRWTRCGGYYYWRGRW